MSSFFEFEADFVDTLRCIPMQVRLKLDTCGIKLKLPQWNQFSQDDRTLLVELPCNSPTEIQTYRATLQKLVWERTESEASELPIDPAPAWMDVTLVPTCVQEKVAELGTALKPEQWANLTPLQRFALIKLSRSSHENRNFLPALKEFGLNGP